MQLKYSNITHNDLYRYLNINVSYENYRIIMHYQLLKCWKKVKMCYQYVRWPSKDAFIIKRKTITTKWSGYGSKIKEQTKDIC